MDTAIEGRATQAQAAPVDLPYDPTIDLRSRVVETGLIPPDRRVYLHDGRPYEKMAWTRAHGSVGAAVTRAVDRRPSDVWSHWPESTNVLDPSNAPLPDFTVFRSGDLLGRAAPERYPEAGDVGLLIEAEVTSLRDDLTTLLGRYARAAIPACWVIDVQGRRILVHTEPRVVAGRGEYARAATYRPDETLPLVLDGQEVAGIRFDELLR